MHKVIEIGIWAGGAAVVSGVATYFVTRNYMAKKFQEFVHEEVADIREHYREVIQAQKALIRNEVEKETLEKFVSELGYEDASELEEELEDLAKDDVDEVEEEEVSEEEEDDTLPSHPGYIWDIPQLTEDEYINGVGIDPDPDEDEDEETGLVIPRGRIQKEPDYPFTITESDYFDDERDYDKLDLMYYEADDILADSRDEIVDDVEGTIGPDALESFGHLSKDPNVVYVRNRSREADFSIVRNPGSYSVEVHGMDPADLDLKPGKKSLKKMREDE